MQGTIKFYNEQKKFGFIENGEGPDIYFRAEAFTKPFRFLRKGAEVTFDVFPGSEGRLFAKNISLVTSTSSRSAHQAARKHYIGPMT